MTKVHQEGELPGEDLDIHREAQVSQQEDHGWVGRGWAAGGSCGEGVNWAVVCSVVSCADEANTTGLEFVKRENSRDQLVSVGEDRRLVEYDLENSDVEHGLL